MELTTQQKADVFDWWCIVQSCEQIDIKQIGDFFGNLDCVVVYTRQPLCAWREAGRGKTIEEALYRSAKHYTIVTPKPEAIDAMKQEQEHE